MILVIIENNIILLFINKITRVIIFRIFITFAILISAGEILSVLDLGLECGERIINLIRVIAT